jgi:hypothetical protein
MSNGIKPFKMGDTCCHSLLPVAGLNFKRNLTINSSYCIYESIRLSKTSSFKSLPLPHERLYLVHAAIWRGK